MSRDPDPAGRLGLRLAELLCEVWPDLPPGATREERLSRMSSDKRAEYESILAILDSLDES